MGAESPPHGHHLASAAKGWVSASSRSSSLRDKEIRSHFLNPPVLMRGERTLWYAECSQLTWFSFPHPSFPSSAASGTEMKASAALCILGIINPAPKAHTVHCSLGGVRAIKYPQNSLDWGYQPTDYYIRSFLKENGLQNHDNLTLRLWKHISKGCMCSAHSYQLWRAL